MGGSYPYMSYRRNETQDTLSPLDSTFSQDEVSMDLTRCGLLVENAEQIAQLYAQHSDWTVVEEKWLQGRFDERSTRSSSKGIFRILSSRFKTAGSALPAIAQLPSIFDECATTQDKAQILYLYLIEDDPLVRYTVHQYIQRLQESGTDGLDFTQETIERILNEFHYGDGSEFDYAESTTRRWGEGIRSVMRKIGVLETQQAVHGQIPALGTIPLLVASGYSWERMENEWLSSPVGWLYLFQSEQYWESLAERVGEHPDWEASGIHGEFRLQPVDETYGWAEPMEGDT
jgi:hypothetical protein